MSAEQQSAEIERIAEALSEHIFLCGFTTINGPQKSRCTCGYVYDNPNASEGFSHPLHVASALVADGWRHHPTPSARASVEPHPGVDAIRVHCPRDGWLMSVDHIRWHEQNPSIQPAPCGTCGWTGEHDPKSVACAFIRPEAPCVHDGGKHCLRGTPGCDCPPVTRPADGSPS